MKKLLLVLLGLSILGSAQAERSVSIFNDGAYAWMYLSVNYTLGDKKITSTARAIMGERKYATFPNAARSIKIIGTSEHGDYLNVVYPDRESRELAIEIHANRVVYCGLRTVPGWEGPGNNCGMVPTHAVSLFHDDAATQAELHVTYTTRNGLPGAQSVTAYHGNNHAMIQLPLDVTSVKVNGYRSQPGDSSDKVQFLTNVVYPNWESRILTIQPLPGENSAQCAYAGQPWAKPTDGTYGCGLN